MQTYKSKNEVWDVSKLIELSKDMEVISWEVPFDFLQRWSWGEDHISEHILRCVKADCSYPILICDGYIVDGCHRTCRALSRGQAVVKAVDLTDCMPSPDFYEEADDHGESKWSFGDMVQILRALDRVEYDFRHPIDGV